MKKPRGNKGFTLVEIAIVLVIIGLILGGVLKGQEIIQNAKDKRLKSDVDGLQAAVFSYQDRYDYLPGDDLEADIHVNAPPASNGDADGIWDVGEQPNVYLHLRLAHFITGSGTTPKANPYGGQYLFYYRAFGLGIGSRNCIWIENLPNTVAESLDSKYDDGVWDTGLVQANGDYTTAGLRHVYFAL